MRRTTAAFVGTLSGAALLLAAKFGATAANGPGAAGTGQAAGGTGDLAPGDSAAGAPGGGSGPIGGQPAPKKLKDGVFRGTASVNVHGPIQVTIKVAGGRITGVAATHATSPAKTVQVNKRAIPVLRKETLTAQSAKIDTVSGATYTSGSFARSLQSALAAAKR